MCVRTSNAFYGVFILDMDRSPGFGPAVYEFFALLRLAFAPAPRLRRLTIPYTAARRTVLQKVRRYPTCPRKNSTGLRQFEGTGFQVLFHSPPGVLFTFPSQYYSLSVTK